MGPVIGIDFGTTNSLCAWLDGDRPAIIPNARGDRSTPSVAASTAKGEILVGESAKNQALVNPDNTVAGVKRLLASGGLLVSEFAPGTEIRKSSFPERNRVISGFCRGILVVEAPSGSGALITADFALEQGRDVFVAASRLAGPRSAGLDGLASDGALAVSSARGVLAEWGIPAEGFAGLADHDARGSFPGYGAGEGAFLAEALRAELGLDLAALAARPEEPGARQYGQA